MASGRERATASAAALAVAAGLPHVLVQPQGAPYSVDGDRSLAAGQQPARRRIVRRRFRMERGGHVRARIAVITLLLITFYPFDRPSQRKFVRLRVRCPTRSTRCELQRVLQVGRQGYNRVLWFLRARTALRWVIAQVRVFLNGEKGSHFALCCISSLSACC